MKLVPLNIKSCYSFGSSVLSVEEIASFPFPCLCDDSFLGLAAFVTKCKAEGKQYLFGLTINNVFQCLVFPRDIEGYQVLLRYQQSNDFQLIIENQEHLIIVLLSYNKLNTESDPLTFLNESVGKFAGLFSSFYLGLEYYQKRDERFLEIVRTVAAQYHVRVVVASEVTAATEYDLQIAKVWSQICKKQIDLEGRFLKGNNELNSVFFPHELSAGEEIFNSCQVDIFTLKVQNPSYALEENKLDFLRSLSLKGLARRLNGKVLESYRRRLEYEIQIIADLGYVDYFLIVYDYVLFARRNQILVGPGRGSACASLTAYCLGITEIDPMRHQLVFERFLNPMRQSQPDIDIDVPNDKRQLIIDYLLDKYQKEHIALIVTMPIIGSSRAFKEIGKLINVSDTTITQINKLIAKKIKSEAEKREFTRLSGAYSQLFNYARKIAKLPYARSVHPSGIIISGSKLADFVPLISGDINCCQFDIDYLEKFNLFKFDILSLNNLSIIETALQFIEQVEGKQLNFNKINIDDPALYHFINSTAPYGLFQLESPGMQQAMKKIQMKSFNDITALLALYRPGPIQMIDQYVSGTKVNHPILAPILQSTRGIILYQEQIMQICQDFALLSLAQADLFRRAISKKHSEQFLELKKVFFSGAKRNNIPETVITEVYQLLEKFAGYGFNKAHAVAYATLTMRMCYLKYFHLSSFIAALANNCGGEARQMRLRHGVQLGLTILPPNVNCPKALFTPLDQKTIIYPLTAVKLVTMDVAQLIINDFAKGRFESLTNFIQRINLRSEQYEQLIYSGALDELHQTRQVLIGSLASAQEYISFGFEKEFKSKVAKVSQRELLLLQYEALGEVADFSLLNSRREEFILKGYRRSYQFKEGERIVFPCIVLKTSIDRMKNVSASGVDQYGQIRLLFNYDTYKNNFELLSNEAILLIHGTVIINREVCLKVAKVEKLHEKININ